MSLIFIMKVINWTEQACCCISLPLGHWIGFCQKCLVLLLTILEYKNKIYPYFTHTHKSCHASPCHVSVTPSSYLGSQLLLTLLSSPVLITLFTTSHYTTLYFSSSLPSTSFHLRRHSSPLTFPYTTLHPLNVGISIIKQAYLLFLKS